MAYEIIEVPVSNGFYTFDSLPISHQECTNWVPIKPEAPSLSAFYSLFGTPGITQIATSGSSATDINRGAWDLGGVPYFVNGTTLYKLTVSTATGSEVWTLTNKGTIPGSGRVSMADNGTQLMILIPGSNGYIYTESGGLTQIVDADFTANGDPQYVVFIDGYFACSTDGKKWIVSALKDGMSWNALDFGTAESDPDAVIAPIVYRNQIFLTGSETTETFQNIGGADFPFQRGNQFFDKGCYAPATLIATNERFFMVGGGKNESPAVWMFKDGSFTKVSTIPIDEVISSYSEDTVAAAFSLSWGSKGQYFVAFVFTDRAFVYNITTGLWHEQKSGIPNDDGDLVQTRWRVNSLVTAYGYVLVADNQDGRIGKLSIDYYTEYDLGIVSVFSTQPIANKSRSFRLPVVELTMEPGVGNADAPNPKVSMAISEDNFKFQYERVRRVGKVGKYGQRTIWRKNGRIPRFCTLRFRFSDPCKRVVTKLEVGISP
jgi:hypothetical protein